MEPRRITASNLSFYPPIYLFTFKSKKEMSRKIKEFDSVVSFRIGTNEKQELERLIQVFKTTKSEFLRDWMNRVLITNNL